MSGEKRDRERAINIERARASQKLASWKARLKQGPLRLVAAVVGAVVWSVGLTVGLIMTLGLTLGGVGVPASVGVFIIVLGCAWGIGTAVWWYRKKT